MRALKALAALLGLSLACGGSASGAAIDVSFAVDPRVEFVSALLRTAKKAPARVEYEKEAAAFLAPFAADPAAAAVAAEADADRRGGAPLRRALGAQPPDAGVTALYARSRFDRFVAAHAAVYAPLVAAERRRAAADLRPEAVARYLGSPLAGRHRFILAPLLDETYETDFAVDGASPTWVWIHAGRHKGRPGVNFMFASFGNSVAHELTHTVVDPLVRSRPDLPGPPPKGCNDEMVSSWRECAVEHVVYAVTLRALALDGRPAQAAEWLRTLTPRGFPLLPALCARLREEYEPARGRYPTLESFYPRLEELFTESSARPGPPADRP